MIDLTLDAILVPALIGYEPPFGTKITETSENKGGLSTAQVNNNVLYAFATMRAAVVSVSDETTEVEYNASLNIDTGGVTLTLGNASYAGCQISVFCTASSGYVMVKHAGSIWLLYPGEHVSLIWVGSDWKGNQMITGRIAPYGGTAAPEGYFMCDGAELDRRDQPRLFAVIGTSFNRTQSGQLVDDGVHFSLPDARQCALVGAGMGSTQDIANNDEYSVGQFKDDQFQDHSISLSGGTGWGTGSQTYYTWGGGQTNIGNQTKYPQITNGRRGSVTRGKRLGINFIIKY